MKLTSKPRWYATSTTDCTTFAVVADEKFETVELWSEPAGLGTLRPVCNAAVLVHKDKVTICEAVAQLDGRLSHRAQADLEKALWEVLNRV